MNDELTREENGGKSCPLEPSEADEAIFAEVLRHAEKRKGGDLDAKDAEIARLLGLMREHEQFAAKRADDLAAERLARAEAEKVLALVGGILMTSETGEKLVARVRLAYAAEARIGLVEDRAEKAEHERDALRGEVAALRGELEIIRQIVAVAQAGVAWGAELVDKDCATL